MKTKVQAGDFGFEVLGSMIRYREMALRFAETCVEQHIGRSAFRDPHSAFRI